MIMTPKIQSISLGLLSSVLFPTSLVLAQAPLPEPFAYPTKGQTEQQQQQDHFACYSWAKEQTGVDPSQLPPVTTAQSSQQAQPVRGLFRRREEQQQQQQQAQAKAQANATEQQRLQTYDRAWTACMQGRGYTVN